MPVAPDLQPLLDAMAAPEARPIQDGTPQEAREMIGMTEQLRRPDQEVGGVETAPDEVAGCPARVYRPEGATGPMPTMLFLHGGGFVVGDLDTHDAICRLLARECWATVVAVDYPLAPEHPFPAAPETAVRAMREVAARRESYGGDDRLAVGGDSAGGNLSAVVAQQCRDLRLQAQLLIYPVVDPYGEWASREENGSGYFLDLAGMAWFQGHYAAGIDEETRTDPLMAPLHGDLAGLAPAVVATAEMDPLRDEGEAYAAALADAGVPVDAKRYDGQIHGFVNFDFLAESSRAAIMDLLARFRTLLHG
ncbi:acetylhydrolase [Marmoricola endophyticus]|uniref:Acetylhydrolase n=1 Tax=Marmoricola endophyticus TaxID=2040280 RepID=A0A917BMK3_9ACTN|nr:alpha/beta hydrolase [Marmoricola endophyticus]GGF51888.1 acetylhydrolase [Marmoricola endophyticus]